jgi:anti-sigma factor RsiW
VLSFALASVLAVGIGSAWWSANREDRLLQEAVGSHVRATLSQRLVDVASSDRHTVKPWLSSKLDYSPPVQDVPLAGSVFLGGRLDYLDGRPTAVLVYKLGNHGVDVFVSVTGAHDAPVRMEALRGFHAAHWSSSGMHYLAVSDVNRDDLQAFAQAMDRANRAMR